MKNTGTIYGSDERQPVILPELAELLPPLTGEQLAALEADLLENGCYSPIIVNEDMAIVDGHNRWRLCQQHNIPYKMAVFAFADMLETKQWMLDTQKGRRNLTKWELGKIALKMKPDLEARAKENMAAGGGDQKSEDAKSGFANSQNPISPVNTTQELAETVGIGSQTMSRISHIDEHAPEAVKKALDNNEMSINKGYELTKQFQGLPEEKREQAAAEAIEKEKALKELREADAEIDRQKKIANQFCKVFEKAIVLEASEENVRIWAECCCMSPDDMADTVQDAKELSETFAAIANIMESLIPKGNGGDSE